MTESEHKTLQDLGLHIRVRDVFKAHCGDGARYVSSETGQRDGHETIIVTFETVPEGRRFRLDGVVREAGIDGAVMKIADIAKNVREHIKTDA